MPVTVIAFELTVWPGVAFSTGANENASGVVSAAAAPVPVNETVCGLPAALSVTVSVPVRVPACVGVNTTLMLHDPGGRLAPQLFVWEKSPEVEMPEIVSVALPPFVSVTVFAAEATPIVVDENVSDGGLSCAVGALPAVGVTLFEAADAGPVPTAFDAFTVNVYDVPLTRLVTTCVVAVEPALESTPPDGFDVTV
jgi:hypothetical protein